ncbi:hypothetical protein U746_0032 [Mycolicibacterium mucogenicum 261Sha1.1M5]|nr:hypothetical protein U746_0032 [Mycolicibacterium mucogenicum 261Sha1.1M5]
MVAATIAAGMLAATGAALPGPWEHEAAAATSVECGPGYVYSVGESGQIMQIDPQGNVTEIGPGRWAGPQLNGLALTEDGSRAYAYQRVTNPYGYNEALRMRSFDGGLYSNSLAELPAPVDRGLLVAGGVDFKTGEFVVGGFSQVKRDTGEEYLLKLFGVTYYGPQTSTIREIGYVWTGLTPSAAGSDTNGDLAFDSAGNLFVVASGAVTHLLTITAADLAAATGGELRAQRTTPGTIALKNLNGIAFDSDGSVFLGNGTTVQRYDPTNWQLLSTHTTGLTDSTDLASCNSPATIEVTKNVGGRVNPGDQFSLWLSNTATGSVIAGAQTIGTANGVQSERIQPVPVLQGKTYTFSEGPSGTTTLEEYQATWSCINTRTGENIRSGTGIGGEVTIPVTSGGGAAAVRCEIRNSPKQALETTLTLVKKFNNSYGAPENPGLWKLWAQPDSGSRLNFSSGNTAVVTPGQYTLGEESRFGFDLERIDCTVDGKSRVVDAQNRLTLAAGEEATCALVSKDRPGKANWRKTDSESGNLVGGSEWRLEGPDGSITVIDNTGGAGGAQGNDTNPEAGRFTVDKLQWGEYKLTETKAPPGYGFDTAPKVYFTLKAGGLTQNLGPVPNELRLAFSLEKYGYAKGQRDPQLLDGSTFTVREDASGKPGAEVADAVVPSSTGTFEVTGLRPGSYWLTETEAPAGYAPLTKPVAFEVTRPATAPEGKLALTDGTHPLVTVSADGKTLKVQDSRAVELPEAGAGGARPYFILGLSALVVALAAYSAVAWSRRHPGRHA